MFVRVVIYLEINEPLLNYGSSDRIRVSDRIEESIRWQVTEREQ